MWSILAPKGQRGYISGGLLEDTDTLGQYLGSNTYKDILEN
jgi:hypothetical protein